MKHARRTIPPLIAAALVAVLSLSSAATGSTRTHIAGSLLAHAAGKCKLQGHERTLGPTYVTYLSVSGGASCSGAMKLVRSYYKCRTKHGGATGHCSGTEGFRCSERRYQKIVVQYSAHVTCTKSSEVVRHNYTQFT